MNGVDNDEFLSPRERAIRAEGPCIKAVGRTCVGEEQSCLSSQENQVTWVSKLWRRCFPAGSWEKGSDVGRSDAENGVTRSGLCFPRWCEVSRTPWDPAQVPSPVQSQCLPLFPFTLINDACWCSCHTDHSDWLMYLISLQITWLPGVSSFHWTLHSCSGPPSSASHIT